MKKNVDKIREFLLDMYDAKPFKKATVQVITGTYGIRWDFEQGYVSVLFGPNDDWQWEVNVQVAQSSISGDTPPYKMYMSYSGKPSFYIKEQPNYCFPDKVDKLISLPDVFSRQYQPTIPKHEYHVVWTTNYYDGMLSGYCRHKGKLHYFDCIEETDFMRNRIFAVWQLSLWERFAAYFHHFKWNLFLYNRTYWAIKRKTWKIQQKITDFLYGDFKRRKEKFEQTHKIVGFFPWE